MEDREGAAALTAARVEAAGPRRVAVEGPRAPAGGWLVSPAFDLLFVANVSWPLLLLPGLSGRAETAVDFWQVYFLTLPHRWITLVLVAADPDRRGGRGWLLAGIALALMLGVAGVWYGTAAFTCLALADYAWNAWHFASQHSGVLRIYGMKSRSGWPALDRHGVRFFVSYVLLRTAAWSTGWLDDSEESARRLLAADLSVLAVPAALLGRELWGASRARAGRLAYVSSLTSLYTGLMLSLALGWGPGVIALTTASSLFHAVEYLAVVSHYAARRREVGSAGAFRAMARAWPALLAVYAVLLGAGGVWIEGLSTTTFEVWPGLNLWAAFVHYAFDGLIWKLRRPETARALGAQAAAGAA